MPELPDDVAARVDELYCLPLERFVPERDALAKELRAERRREEAAVVAKLAKPSVAAWAVNQVVRSQGDAAQGLWRAGDAVLAVQERAVAGKASGGELREAIAAERAALAPLADAARGMLTGRGAFLGEQAVQQVIETLHAAAVDREARPEVEEGRTTRPLRLAGLGALPAGPARSRVGRGGGASEEPPTSAGPSPSAPERRRAAAEERAAREAARRAAKERERVRAAAERAFERARRARDAALERVERRRAELEAAEADLAEAEEAVGEAEEALRDAEDALGDVGD